MPKLLCTEPVCRHSWSEPSEPDVPRCPRCGGFWVRVVGDAAARSRTSSRRGRLLARRGAVVGRAA